MKNAETATAGSARRVWTHLFIGILSLQAIFELVLGGYLLFKLPYTLKSGFGIVYRSELDILGIALGLYLLLLTALMVLSCVWAHRSNLAGITLGIIVGVFLVTFGVATLLKFGDFEGILVDSIRGLLTIFLAYMAGKEIKQQQ
jgi:hypothetical protein